MSLARRLRDYFSPREMVNTSPSVSDEVKYTTCYMCACRCGIKVHLKDGAHPLHRGQPRPPGQPRRDLRQGRRRHHAALCRRRGSRSRCCASASAAPASSARSSGTRRSRPRSAGCRRSARPTRTSSPSSPAATRASRLTGLWAAQFGTPNYAAHGGFCSVNMAAAGMYTIGGSFWEFGEPDWERTRYFMMFGVAEDHDSQPDQARPVRAAPARRQVRLGQPGAHRLFGDRRRMDRHPARHRRAVRPGADPRTAARPAGSISTISAATPTPPGS